MFIDHFRYMEDRLSYLQDPEAINFKFLTSNELLSFPRSRRDHKFVAVINSVLQLTSDYRLLASLFATRPLQIFQGSHKLQSKGFDHLIGFFIISLKQAKAYKSL